MTIHDDGKRLTLSQGGTTLRMEAWGEHSIRVRMTKEAEMNTEDWALTEPIPDLTPEIHYETVDMTPAFYRTAEERAAHAETGTKVTFRNGNLTAVIDPEGVISYYNEKNELLTKELWQNRNRIDRFCVPLRIDARELKPITGTTDYTLAMRFEAFDDEKIFGMGQYQDDFLDKKGCILELAHRNSQASVPFMISSRGYGFLWNNPAIGTASFAKNKTEWTALNTKKLDYWICAGDSPKQLTELYSAVTGRVPMIPEYGIGFWQCKLRYRTQEELLTVAREYKRRGLPIDAIVVDFFHWTMQGDFKFDPKDWPDPEAMIRELREMQIEPVVSVWPTIDERSENYGPMADQGYLITSDRGLCVNMTWMGTTTFYDATHQPHAFYPVEHTGHDSGLAVAQAGVQPAGGGVLLVGVHAQHGAAALSRIAFIEGNKGGAVAPPRPKRVYHKGVKHHNLIRLSVVKPAHLCVYRHLYTVDYGGGNDLPAVHADKQVSSLQSVQRGLAGGVNSPLPAYCKTALLLRVNYAAVYGSDGINMLGCGFYELHIRIPCLRSLRERWA